MPAEFWGQIQGGPTVPEVFGMGGQAGQLQQQRQAAMLAAFQARQQRLQQWKMFQAEQQAAQQAMLIKRQEFDQEQEMARRQLQQKAVLDVRARAPWQETLGAEQMQTQLREMGLMTRKEMEEAGQRERFEAGQAGTESRFVRGEERQKGEFATREERLGKQSAWERQQAEGKQVPPEAYAAVSKQMEELQGRIRQASEALGSVQQQKMLLIAQLPAQYGLTADQVAKVRKAKKWPKDVDEEAYWKYRAAEQVLVAQADALEKKRTQEWRALQAELNQLRFMFTQTPVLHRGIR